MYVSDILFVVGHCCAKESVVLLLRRLGRDRPYKRLCDLISAVIALWGVASTLAIALKCDLARPWLVNNHCVRVVGDP